jgi:hypothetical protein
MSVSRSSAGCRRPPAVRRGPDRSGKPRQRDPREDHRGRERGEHRRAAADAQLVEVQDHEARERRVADVGQEERDARAHRRAEGSKRLALARSGGRLARSGTTRAIAAPASGASTAKAHTASYEPSA